MKIIESAGACPEIWKGGGGGRNFMFSTENIGEDPPKKNQRFLRCPVSTVSLTADMYLFYYFSGGGGGGAT